MTRTEELLALAEKVPSWNEVGAHNIGLLKKYHEGIPPEAIKQLIALVRLQHEALTFAADFIPASCCKVGECEVCKAIEAFDKFERGEA